MSRFFDDRDLLQSTTESGHAEMRNGLPRCVSCRGTEGHDDWNVSTSALEGPGNQLVTTQPVSNADALYSALNTPFGRTADF